MGISQVGHFKPVTVCQQPCGWIMLCGCIALRTSLVLLIQSLQHLLSPSILLIQQSPVQSSPGKNAAPFLPSEMKLGLGAAKQECRWQRGGWCGIKALSGQISTGQDTHERHWRKPGLPRAGVTGGSVWGLGKAAGEPGHTPMPPRDPASALPTNAVASGHLLSSSHKKKYFSS